MFPVKKLSELGDDLAEDICWMLKGFLALGVITEFIGLTYVGKSTLIANMIRCGVTGDSFLGFQATKFKPLLLTEEYGVTFRELYTNANIFGTPLADGIDYVSMRDYVNGLDDWATIMNDAIAHCQDNGNNVVVIDNLTVWTQIRNIDDTAEWLEILRHIQRLAASGVAVLVMRHPRKQNSRLELAGAGSHAVSAGVDISFQMREPSFIGEKQISINKNDRIVTGRGRLNDVPEYLHLQFDKSTFTYSLGSTLEPQKESSRDTLGEVEEAIRHENRPMTIAELIKVTKGYDSTIRRALKGSANGRFIPGETTSPSGHKAETYDVSERTSSPTA